MPAQIRKCAALPNKIIDQEIIGRLQYAIKDRRKCQSVITVRSRVRYSIDLNGADFQMQIKLLSNLPG
jgi:hypothetical protein